MMLVMLPFFMLAIMQLFDSKEEKEYVSQNVDNEKIAEGNYDLSVSSYVEKKDTREVIDIDVLNAEIKKTVKNIDTIADIKRC